MLARSPFFFINPGGEAMVTSEKFFLGLMLLVCLAFVCTGVSAAEIPEDRAVKAIIGEAENQGYTGMLAVACAIRNRGTLKGVYGEKAPRVVQKKYSQKIYDLAKKAWRESLNSDITNGGDHWENVTAFGVPSWAKNMKLVYQHKDHNFYRK
jgi:hypothetical protein